MYVRALSTATTPSSTTTLRRKKQEPEDPYAKVNAGPNYHALVSWSVLCTWERTRGHPSRLRSYTKQTPPMDKQTQIPLLYAPVLPLIRVGLRGRLPQKQIDIIFGASVLTALAHAGYIMASDSSV